MTLDLSLTAQLASPSSVIYQWEAFGEVSSHPQACLVMCKMGIRMPVWLASWCFVRNHEFIQHTLVEHLLCTKHYSRS